MLSYLLFALGFSFACVVQPGPFQAFLLSQSLMSGWRKASPLIFIPLISDIPVIVIVVLILSSLPKEVLVIMQFLGGAFLLYLGFKAYQSWKRFTTGEEPGANRYSTFFKGVVINVLNPNAYIGWGLVMGPMLIKAWTETPLDGIVLLAGFYGSMLVYSFGLVFLFATVRNFGPRVTRISILVSAVTLALFGVYQILSGAGLHF
jgi:threonine/homoserine/homoserine lactone efflux protein